MIIKCEEQPVGPAKPVDGFFGDVFECGYGHLRCDLGGDGTGFPLRDLLAVSGHRPESEALVVAVDLRDSTGGKCPRRVRHYYEETIDDRNNPIWWSLSEQYAHAVHAVDTPNLLLQNINPIVAVLKAEQFGLLDVGRLGGLNITGVVHDGADAAQRFRYVAQRIERTRADVLLIAVSEAVRQPLTDCGVPGQVVRKVLNGLDVEQFRERLRRAGAGEVFVRVRGETRFPRSAGSCSSRPAGCLGRAMKMSSALLTASKSRAN